MTSEIRPSYFLVGLLLFVVWIVLEASWARMEPGAAWRDELPGPVEMPLRVGWPAVLLAVAFDLATTLLPSRALGDGGCSDGPGEALGQYHAETFPFAVVLLVGVVLAGLLTALPLRRWASGALAGAALVALPAAAAFAWTAARWPVVRLGAEWAAEPFYAPDWTVAPHPRALAGVVLGAAVGAWTVALRCASARAAFPPAPDEPPRPLPRSLRSPRDPSGEAVRAHLLF